MSDNKISRKLILTIPLIVLFLFALIFSTRYVNQQTQADDGIPGPEYWRKLRTEQPMYDLFSATSVPLEQRTYIDNPANYHMVYLAAPGAIADNSLVSPAGLIPGVMKADTAYSWQDVMQADQRRPIQAILIHQSAAAMVDPNWLRAAGRDGKVIILVNMHFADYGNMINSPCIQQQAQDMVNPFEGRGDYFYMVVGLTLANNPAEQPLVDAALYDNCNPSSTLIPGGVTAWGHAAHNLLDNPNRIGDLTDMVIGMINMIQSQRQAYASRGQRPPTPVPGFSN